MLRSTTITTASARAARPASRGGGRLSLRAGATAAQSRNNHGSLSVGGAALQGAQGAQGAVR